jgi:hypothetical protein
MGSYSFMGMVYKGTFFCVEKHIISEVFSVFMVGLGKNIVPKSAKCKLFSDDFDFVGCPEEEIVNVCLEK